MNSTDPWNFDENQTTLHLDSRDINGAWDTQPGGRLFLNNHALDVAESPTLETCASELRCKLAHPCDRTEMKPAPPAPYDS